ncbi:MAG: hypothetical protein GXO24_03390, partial [Chlorobi bacterium]|nr:hypothetical protein [Chlorobiota bacterium]
MEFPSFPSYESPLDPHNSPLLFEREAWKHIITIANAGDPSLWVHVGMVILKSKKYLSDKYFIPNLPHQIVLFVSLKSNKKLVSLKSDDTTEGIHLYVTKLPLAGITVDDIGTIYAVSLGRGLFLAVQVYPKIALEIADRIFEWFDASPRRHQALYISLVNKILRFVQTHTLKDFETLSEWDKLLALLAECISLGIMGLDSGFTYLKTQIFYAFAQKIRSYKLKEDRWNPAVSRYRYFPEEESGNVYKPLIGFNENFIERVDAFLADFENRLKPSLFPISSFPRTFDEDVVADILTVRKHLLDYLRERFHYFRIAFISILKEINYDVKGLNAFIVGFINGMVEVLATLVESLGDWIGLLTYEGLKNTVGLIHELFKLFDWEYIKKWVKAVTHKLLHFISDEDFFYQAYKLGELIPQAIIIIIQLVSSYAAGKKFLSETGSFLN